MTPIIPGDLPGLPEAWQVFYGVTQMYCPKSPLEYDLRVPADRCLVAFWMARVLGVRDTRVTMPPVSIGLSQDRSQIICHFYEALWCARTIVMPNPSIPLGSPDRDALALACCALWLADELRAGRITPAPSPAVPATDPREPVAALSSEVKP